MEAMIDTAVHIGIPREMAKIMVGNTVKVRQTNRQTDRQAGRQRAAPQ
jgi:hypothetical protein